MARAQFAGRRLKCTLLRAVVVLPSGIQATNRARSRWPETEFVLLRVLLAAFVWFAATADCSRAQGMSLRVQVFPFTGEVRFQNKNLEPFPFVFYSIHSPGGTLDPSAGVWKSISDNYDMSGNGFIDPLHNWAKVEATNMDLIEAVSTGPGGVLPMFQSVSLGNIWNHGTMAELADPDFEIQVIHPDETDAQIEIRRSIAGDYDDNRRVDTNDYYLWKLFYGSSVSDGPAFFYFADGNYDGKVDAGDYVVWRNNLGKELPPLVGEATGAGGLAVGSIVPEPAGAALLLAAISSALLAGCRRRREIREVAR